MPPAARWSASWARPGFLKLCVADGDSAPDVRSLAIARATLARARGLADFAFAMQGLGSGAISLFGSDAQKAEWLPKVAGGEAIAAFALTEPETGSDAANIAMRRRATATAGCLDGEKTYISNGTIADVLTVFARTGRRRRRARAFRAFIVRGRRSRPVGRRADRGDRAASARPAQVRRRPRPS